MTRDVFDAVPIWAVFLFSTLLIVFALELGHRLGIWYAGSAEVKEDKSSGVISGAILGLVSFLLAFTFSVAANNHGTRKAVVLQEANVLGTAYLRTDLLPEDEARRAATLIRDYTRIRVDAAREGIDRQQFPELLRQSEDIQRELWQIVSSDAKANPTPLSGLTIGAINELIDIHSVRLNRAISGRLPASVWVCLYTLSAIGMATAAFGVSAQSGKRPVLLPGMVFAFAAVITMIADLDNPRYGFLTGDQRSLEQALAAMAD